MLVVYAGLIGLTGWQFQRTPTGFIPEQDQGYLISVSSCRPAPRSTAPTRSSREWVEAGLEVEGVIHGVAFAGFNGATFTNAPDVGTVFLTLAPFEERIEKGIDDRGDPGRRAGQGGPRSRRRWSWSSTRRRCAASAPAAASR